MDAADADDSGAVLLNDAVSIFTSLFLGGEAPIGGDECHEDFTSDSLGCETDNSCDF